MTYKTIDNLSEINRSYIIHHGRLSKADLEKANYFSGLIEITRRNDHPTPGDVIQYTDPHASYYAHAHIESIDEDGASVCNVPHVPFVYDEDGAPRFNTSGGAWSKLSPDKMILKGKETKTFQFWGGCGPAAHGTISISAEVNVWEYIAPQKYIDNQTGEIYTEKNYNKVYISFSKLSNDFGYHYYVSGENERHAFKTEDELQAYLLTYRAKVFTGNWPNQAVAFLWNEKVNCRISPEDYDNLRGTECTLLNNGVRPCKRLYNEGEKTIYTYFVWYWEDPRENWREVLAEQNKMRDSKYISLTDRPYSFEFMRLKRGESKPLNLCGIDDEKGGRGL